MSEKTHPDDERGSTQSPAQPHDVRDKAGAAFAGKIQRIASEPKKGARLIARTFYRELRRGGWTDGDIMAIADELLGCLIAKLHEYRVKKDIPEGKKEELADPLDRTGM
jgi:hypothetical protein